MKSLRPYRSFVSYIDRSREFYAAQGYPEPYAWAHHDDVPFAHLQKPLSLSRVGLVTTAGKPQPEGEGASQLLVARDMYTEPSDPPPPRLFTNDLGWDKEATHTEDVESFLPLRRLAEYAAGGRIGSVSPRFYGVPTDYSQRRVFETYAPRVLDWCREDGLDALLLFAL